MNISPVSFNNFKGAYPQVDEQISKMYPSYRPSMRDDEVVSWGTQDGDRYPFTAAQVRAEIAKLEILASRLEKEEAQRQEDEARFQKWFDEQGRISTWGGDYFYRS